MPVAKPSHAVVLDISPPLYMSMFVSVTECFHFQSLYYISEARVLSELFGEPESFVVQYKF